jgi:cytoskeletal protein CcmA (bactofilin family)
MEKNNLPESSLTVISQKTKIVGTLEVQDEVHFFGHVMGEIMGASGSEIYLKEDSLVEGKVIGDTVIIEGFVKGEVIAQKKIWVTAMGKVFGSIRSPSIQIDPGAYFEAKGITA